MVRLVQRRPRWLTCRLAFMYLEELQKESAHERGNYAQSSDASSPPAPWSVRGISMCCEQGVDAMHSMLISLARRSSALLAAWC